MRHAAGGEHMTLPQSRADRLRWESGDVAIWDNRVVNHSATFDAYVS